MAAALGNKGSVAILLGAPGNNVTTLRTKGFKDQIAKVAPDIKIVFEQTGQFSREEGQKVIRAAAAVEARHQRHLRGERRDGARRHRSP